MGKGWFPNYDLADFEAMVLLDHSVTPDSEGYDFLMMGQQSIVKCLNPLRDAGDWAQLGAWKATLTRAHVTAFCLLLLGTKNFPARV